jgi:putative transposase
MARSPRIAVSGYPHHVAQRGNNRQAIFLSDEDYKFYVDCFLRAKEKYRCRIYAYCLMRNHVHFLIEPSDSQGLSGLLQSVGRRYVQYFNWRHRRSGTLWEGRFRSSLVSMDDYLLACCRYIELNPVRAKVVVHPRDYRWSSYRFHGEGTKDALLDVDSCYLGLGDSDSQRQQSYRQFIEAGNPEHELAFLRTSVQRGGVTGSQSYIRGFSSRLSRQLELRPRGRPRTIQK